MTATLLSPLLPSVNATLDRAKSALALAAEIQEFLWRPSAFRFAV